MKEHTAKSNGRRQFDVNTEAVVATYTAVPKRHKEDMKNLIFSQAPADTNSMISQQHTKKTTKKSSGTGKRPHGSENKDLDLFYFNDGLQPGKSNVKKTTKSTRIASVEPHSKKVTSQYGFAQIPGKQRVASQNRSNLNRTNVAPSNNKVASSKIKQLNSLYKPTAESMIEDIQHILDAQLGGSGNVHIVTPLDQRVLKQKRMTQKMVNSAQVGTRIVASPDLDMKPKTAATQDSGAVTEAANSRLLKTQDLTEAAVPMQPILKDRRISQPELKQQPNQLPPIEHNAQIPIKVGAKNSTGKTKSIASESSLDRSPLQGGKLQPLQNGCTSYTASPPKRRLPLHNPTQALSVKEGDEPVPEMADFADEPQKPVIIEEKVEAEEAPDRSGESFIQENKDPQEPKSPLTATKKERRVREDKSPSFLQPRTSILAGKAANPKYDTTANILVQSTTVEPFIRRAIQKMGWIEVHAQKNTNQAQQFHIRFNITDLDGAASDLRPNQMYNHFPNNRELTTKAGLCKNMWQNCFTEHQFKVSSFVPRCYDLSDLKQAEDFEQDFNQTAILSIIKLMSTHFLEKNEKLQDLIDEFALRKNYASPKVFKRRFKDKCYRLDVTNSMAGNLLGSCDLRLAIQFAKAFLSRLSFQDHSLKKKRYQQYFDLEDKRDEYTSRLVKFHASLVDKGVPSFGITQYEQVKVVLMYNKLLQKLPQFRQIDGSRNIWIVKPSYNARGLGIYCTRQLNQIIAQKKDNTQQKVVQKYIERPFLLNKGRKFDFRQWVLVNSWEPLDACVFSSAYLKICGSSFDLNQISDNFKHLSNYTIQKKSGEDVEELVMSTRVFEEFMRTVDPKYAEFTWQDNMMPKISSVVWSTLKTIQETQDQKNSCFEIYGFDIVLDLELNPWVIEVNLSPACSERTPWLRQMLDESAFDMVNHLQARLFLLYGRECWDQERNKLREKAIQEYPELRLTKNLNNTQFYEEHKPLDRWIRIDESILEIKDYYRTIQLQQTVLGQQNKLELVIPVVKVDARYEKKADLNFKKQKSAQLIQRIWEGSKARRHFRFLKETKASIYIQRFMRMWVAKLALIRLRKARASIKIQKFLRRRLAQKEVNRMRDLFHLKAWTFIATKMQAHYRRKKATQQVMVVRKHARALICQRFIRGALAKRKYLGERARECKIRFIQRFYRRRLQLKNKKAVQVQRFLKGFRHKKLVRKMRKITAAVRSLHKVWVKKTTKSSIKYLTYHSKAIKIQSFLRMVVNRRRYRQLLKVRAIKALKCLLRKNILLHVVKLARDFRQQYTKKVTCVQSKLRGYLARTRVQKMLKNQLEDSAANLVQKYLRGYLGRMTANYYRLQIGASIMIQAQWRRVRAVKRVARLRTMKEFQEEQDAKHKEFQREIELEDEKHLNKDYIALGHRSTSRQYTTGKSRQSAGSKQSIIEKMDMSVVQQYIVEKAQKYKENNDVQQKQDIKCKNQMKKIMHGYVQKRDRLITSYQKENHAIMNTQSQKFGKKAFQKIYEQQAAVEEYIKNVPHAAYTQQLEKIDIKTSKKSPQKDRSRTINNMREVKGNHNLMNSGRRSSQKLKQLGTQEPQQIIKTVIQSIERNGKNGVARTAVMKKQPSNQKLPERFTTTTDIQSTLVSADMDDQNAYSHEHHGHLTQPPSQRTGYKLKNLPNQLKRPAKTYANHGKKTFAESLMEMLDGQGQPKASYNNKSSPEIAKKSTLGRGDKFAAKQQQKAVQGIAQINPGGAGIKTTGSQHKSKRSISNTQANLPRIKQASGSNGFSREPSNIGLAHLETIGNRVVDMRSSKEEFKEMIMSQDSKASNKSDFTMKFEAAKQKLDQEKIRSRSEYMKAAAAFKNQTKGIVDQIRKTQQERVQAISHNLNSSSSFISQGTLGSTRANQKRDAKFIVL